MMPALLSLPVEIRDLIYNHILIQPAPLTFPIGDDFNRQDIDARQVIEHFYALSLSCKQVHYEIEDIFFRYNSFSFLTNKPLPSIPPRCVQKIKSITLYRMLVGKRFSLKMYWRCDDSVDVSVDIVDLIPRPKEEACSSTHVISDMMGFRLAQGAKVAAKMLKQAIEDQGGLSMDILKAIATLMNQQWLIAM